MDRLRTIPVLALCAVYIFLAAGAALLSANVYQAVAASAQAHSERRVALSYVLSQLRAGDALGGIRTLDYGDGAALAIADQDAYETLLYCHDGALMELFTERDLGLPPEAGMVIAPAESMELRWVEDRLQISIAQADGALSQAEYRISSREVSSG